MIDLFNNHQPIKVLSIRQPWASLIVYCGKNIENRTWRTHYRGPLLIHASANRNHAPIPAGAKIEKISDMPTGGIIGIARVIDCVSSHASPWFEGPFGFVLDDARALPFHAFRGRLGLFDAPDEIVKVLYKTQIAEYLAP